MNAPTQRGVSRRACARVAPVRRIVSRTLVLPRTDIDTDQIIPARFLTTTSRDGLGRYAFNDWRGQPDCPLEDPRARSAAVLVAGRNFGCGSSREHAPWALLDCGFRAVVSSEIADIFHNNAVQNGLLPIVVEAEAHTWLLENPWELVAIDLERQTLELTDGRVLRFPFDPFARRCLLEGIDELGYLLQRGEVIEQYEEQRA